MSGGPFISEIHYDNAGTDTGEFVEICAPAGTDMSAFSLVLYNGANGEAYNTVSLPASCGTVGGKDFYVINFPSNGIQNGAPDGMALVNGGTVCEFISYEGSFTATDGPASGMTSTDIVVDQQPAPASGQTLQVASSGGTWEGPVAETPCAPLCFLEGTNVLTSEGYKKIEELKKGDLVQGQNQKFHAIKWLGIQTIEPKKQANPYMDLPIKIKANALAENVPSNDLYLSPNHAVCIDNLLINAGALVNNLNIQNTYSLEPFKYYHIELDSHELVLAENTLAESYLPQNDKREEFDNGAEIEKGKVLLFPLSLPRISSIVKVPSNIKTSILKRSKEAIQKTA